MEKQTRTETWVVTNIAGDLSINAPTVDDAAKVLQELGSQDSRVVRTITTVTTTVSEYTPQEFMGVPAEEIWP